MITRLLIGLFLLFGPVHWALADTSPLDDTVVVPTGEMRALSAEDFAPRRGLGGNYSEVWTYVFLLENGMQAHFSISRANLGRLLGRVSGSEFAVTGFKGRSYRAPKQYGGDEFSYDARAHRLSVSPRIFVEGSLSGQHRVYFEANKDDSRFTLDVTMTDMARGLTWGDGVFHLGDDQIGVYVHVPHARVSGTITVDGVTERVRGTAYMDHTFQTDFAPKLVQNAYRLVEHGSRPSVGFFMTPATRYEQRVVGVGAAMERGRFQLVKAEAVEVISARKKHKADVPYQFVVRYAGGGQTIFNRAQDTQDFAVLGDLGSVARALARSQLGGEPVVVRGRGTTNGNRPFIYDMLVVR